MRNFAEKHGQEEEIYRKTSSSSISEEPIVKNDLHPQITVQSHVGRPQAMVAPRSSDPDIEEEISECKVDCFFVKKLLLCNKLEKQLYLPLSIRHKLRALV